MERPSKDTPAPAPVQKILDDLGAGAVSEESLYLEFSRLSDQELRDLVAFTHEDDWWRLFRWVARRLDVYQDRNRRALRHGL